MRQRTVAVIALFGTFAFAGSAHAQDTAWEIFEQRYPDKAELIMVDRGNGTYKREERKGPNDKGLGVSGVQFGYDEWSWRYWIAMQNHSSEPMCVFPTLVIKNDDEGEVYEDSDMSVPTLIEPHSSEVAFRLEVQFTRLVAGMRFETDAWIYDVLPDGTCPTTTDKVQVVRR